MDAAIKAAWIEALLSGKYNQGVSALKYEDKEGLHYCCLGVLCDVTDGFKKEPIEIPGADMKRYAQATARFRKNAMTREGGKGVGYLTDSLLKKVGLTAEQQKDLCALNDSQQKTFAEIADYIQNNL